MSIIAYILLVFIVTSYSHGSVRIPQSGERLLFCAALLSSCALPWSGVSFFTFCGVHSSLFYPLFALTVFFAQSDSHCQARLKTMLILTFGITVSALLFFTLQIGVPGELGSLESLAAVVRLESIRSGRLMLAAVIFASALTLAFAQVRFKESAGSSALAFVFSGFIVNLFCPISTIEATELAPRLSIALDAALLFTLSLLLKYIIIKNLSAGMSRFDGEASKSVTPVIFALVGSYFLLSEI